MILRAQVSCLTSRHRAIVDPGGRNREAIGSYRPQPADEDAHRSPRGGHRQFARGEEPGHATLDETPVGIYLELEGPARWIDRTAKRLGIPLSDYITENYAGLFHAWKETTGSLAEEMTFKAVKGRRR